MMEKYLISIFARRLFQFFTLIIGALIFISINVRDVYAAMPSISDDMDQMIIEHLRLHVDSQDREAWLDSERASWGKWLINKKGFHGRKLFWDPLREEATLLITWSSYSQWKAIPQGEIEAVQERFEELDRKGTGRESGNPFPLIYEGELLPQ